MSRRIKMLKLDKAVDIAVHYHDAFRHDFGLPYCFHLFAVTNDGSLRGINDEELLCAFFLHDTLEDTTYTEEQMLADFGPRVLSIVKEVSKIGIDDQGIEVKMEFLKQCTGKSLDSLLLKFSDRFCNVNDYKRGDRIWYPAYYALQAYPLVHHFLNNLQNITDMFGENVVRNYRLLINELDDLVVKQYGWGFGTGDNSEYLEIIDDILLNRRRGIYEKEGNYAGKE